MSADDVVTVRQLGVLFGRKPVLGSLDLDVPRGSVTALVGSNGAGKSTLLRVLVGALVPDRGEVRVLGLDPRRAGHRVRAGVGYVADGFAPSRWMRVRDWLTFVARFHASWSLEEERRLLELVELEPNCKVTALSKGNRTKLALVAALAHRPELVLLDEPFSGLDVGVRQVVATTLLGHLRDEGRTVLLVSHSIADIERVADRIAVLEGGRVTRTGDLEDLARSPRGGIDLEALLLETEAA